MAIVQFGVTVVGVRGTIGGITFSANKSGPYGRQWSKGSNPKTVLQSSQRSLLASIPNEWRNLSAAEQALWDTFAALPAQDLINSLGQTYSISGYGWFNKINIRLLVIGRAIRIPVPTQARPSAPSITDSEFPFNVGQTAFVAYPSGEFDPDFDLVLEVGQAASVGRLAPPNNFNEFVVLRDPDDTMTGFAAAYVNRLGIGNTALKGFLRLYRQTTDGLRSAAGAASFISPDAPNYAPGALDYDGAADFALRGADLTGVVNSTRWTECGWFKIDGGAGALRTIRGNTANRWETRLTTGDKLAFFARDSSGATAFTARTVQTFPADGAWHSYCMSINTATQILSVYVDDAVAPMESITIVLDAIIDFSQADHAFGGNAAGATLWDGCLSSTWVSITENLNFDDLAVRRAFIGPSNVPLDLGTTGQLPTGATPILYFPDGDASNNVGGGGNFTNQGASIACATAP